MRVIAFASLCLLVVGPAAASSTDHFSPRRHHQFMKRTFGPKAIAGSAAGAGFAHVRNHPREWGGGASGYGKRFASSFGTHAVGTTIHSSVSGLRHEEMGYQRSGKTGFGPRMKHALFSTVVARKTNTGHRTVAAGNLSGKFGAGMISRAWQPASTSGLGAGVASGGTMLGVQAGTNVAREFWPQHKHRISLKRHKAR